MGRMTVRLPNSLHTKLVELAEKEHISLNHLIVYELTMVTSKLFDLSLAAPRDLANDKKEWKKLMKRLPKSSPSQARKALGDLWGESSGGKRR